MTVDKNDRQRALRLTPVSRETEERLALLVAELARWQAAKNLVSSATLAADLIIEVIEMNDALELAAEATRIVNRQELAARPAAES